MSVFNVVIGPADNPTRLWLYPNVPSLRSESEPVGLIVGAPQGCRSALQGGMSKYGSPEWITHLWFVSNAATEIDILAAQAALGGLLKSSPAAKGCGHISSKVPVTRIDNGGEREEFKVGATEQFYALVVGGSYDDDSDHTSGFNAANIWISTSLWDPNSDEYKEADKRWRDAHTSCPE